VAMVGLTVQEEQLAKEVARVEAEFSKRASEISTEHESLSSAMQQAEVELNARQQALEKELLTRSEELEALRKMMEQVQPSLVLWVWALTHTIVLGTGLRTGSNREHRFQARPPAAADVLRRACVTD
jgi:hypothetical protein